MFFYYWYLWFQNQEKTKGQGLYFRPFITFPFLKQHPCPHVFVVDKQHRGTGVGKELISQIITIALNMGYKKLYLRTEHVTEYYKKLGWNFVDKRTDEFGIEAEIFSKEITSFASSIVLSRPAK
jgi:GNAT superfamily N-acetyltransferase